MGTRSDIMSLGRVLGRDAICVPHGELQKLALRSLREGLGRVAFGATLPIVARPSRPPGFDMTYRPQEASYGPYWTDRIPSYCYASFAAVAVLVLLIAEHSGTESSLFHFIVQRDHERVIGVRTLVAILVGGAVCSLIRTGMRGVQVRGDGIEVRDVTNIIVPRVRRIRWPQIDAIILDQPSRVAFDIWDGSREFLPRVSDRKGLEATLEAVGAARAIPVVGGKGLDEIPERIHDDGPREPPVTDEPVPSTDSG
jgi:hypothetical protein